MQDYESQIEVGDEEFYDAGFDNYGDFQSEAGFGEQEDYGEEEIKHPNNVRVFSCQTFYRGLHPVTPLTRQWILFAVLLNGRLLSLTLSHELKFVEIFRPKAGKKMMVLQQRSDFVGSTKSQRRQMRTR